MVMNSYTWLSMVINGYERLYMVINGYTWLRTVMVISGSGTVNEHFPTFYLYSFTKSFVVF